ncbi:class I SAM-dependent methyltransferase [Marininema halotolerans]|uniref:Methyltransferase domain-containing protein n=1 Tax=Marininema halotolerans TaxID=1155944 RepID=A0A1I6U7F1_9BACL|nr:class I SAM-dependent methyltransferase [Marininema halotolerans]SFS97352.1 Methyltransferase domain-containing protein [Marininema halotolerans]
MDGTQLFNQEDSFLRYMRRREKRDNPNRVIERPIMTQMVGAVKGLDFLDLGCGDASFGQLLLQQGCQSYVGLEGATRMAERGRECLKDTPGKIVETDITTWDYPPEQFDRVLSSLVLHYVKDIPQLLKAIVRTLRPGGRLIFSVEHPVVTACFKSSEGHRRENWLVDDYFCTGERVKPWLGSEVKIYHRTLEDWYRLLQESGLIVENIRESCPDRRQFTSEEEYQRRKRIPLYLFLQGRKPNTDK